MDCSRAVSASAEAVESEPRESLDLRSDTMDEVELELPVLASLAGGAVGALAKGEEGGRVEDAAN